MANSNFREGFKPNDYSSTNRLRYDLEVEHYMRSIRSSEISNSTVSFGEATGTIGAILTLLISLIVLVITSVIELVKWIKTR